MERGAARGSERAPREPRAQHWLRLPVGSGQQARALVRCAICNAPAQPRSARFRTRTRIRTPTRAVINVSARDALALRVVKALPHELV